MRRPAAALLLAAVLGTAPASATPVRRAPAPAARDWSRVATRLPSGAFLLGNPAAKVKVIENLSLTCPHCAVLEHDAAAPLAGYVRTGRVSWEVRLALRDPFDMAAALLARCGGPQRFFAVLPALYAAQNDWVGRGGAWGQTAPDLAKMAPGAAMQAIAAGSGLDVFFAARGLTKASAAACLADEKAQTALAEAAQAIWAQPGFPGTPAVSVDGSAWEVPTWPALQARIDAALR